jgi:hypothetical protein
MTQARSPHRLIYALVWRTNPFKVPSYIAISYPQSLVRNSHCFLESRDFHLGLLPIHRDKFVLTTQSLHHFLVETKDKFRR